MSVQTAAFVAGIVFGSVTLSSASYVWLRHRVFGIGGSVLSLVGVALLGLSIWSGVKIQIGEEGISADFQRLAQRIDALSEANQAVTGEVKKLADIADIGRMQLVELTNALERRNVVQGSALQEIRRPLLTAPSVDRSRLDSAAAQVDRVRPPRTR